MPEMAMPNEKKSSGYPVIWLHRQAARPEVLDHALARPVGTDLARFLSSYSLHECPSPCPASIYSVKYVTRRPEDAVSSWLIQPRYTVLGHPSHCRALFSKGESRAAV